MMVVKNPSDVVNRCVLFTCLFEEVRMSMAIINPEIVTSIAANLDVVGIVITCVFGWMMVAVIRNPVRMLPHARRLIGFIIVLSLIGWIDCIRV